MIGNGPEPFTEIATGGTGTGTVTYGSRVPTVATVDANSGEVTIVAVGATNITATKAADDNYNEATALYILTVTQTIPAELILGRVNGINLNLLFPTIFNGKTYYHVDHNNDKVSDENLGGGGIDDSVSHQQLDHLLNNGERYHEHGWTPGR